MEGSTKQDCKLSETIVKKPEVVHIKELLKHIEKYKVELNNELKHNV